MACVQRASMRSMPRCSDSSKLELLLGVRTSPLPEAQSTNTLHLMTSRTPDCQQNPEKYLSPIQHLKGINMFVAKRSQFRKCATRLLLAFAIFGAVGPNNAHAQVLWPTARDSSHLFGSWLTTYQIAVFGGNTPILLSFTGDGIVIETDTPIPTPFAVSIGTVALTNA